MARFSEVRKHNRGAKRREAKELAAQAPRPTMTASSTAQRVPGAIKPTSERARGKHQRAYEPDPETCDPLELLQWEREQEALEAA